MKQRFLLIAILTAFRIDMLFAVTSDFFTPFSFEQKPRTYVHYPILPELEKCTDWDVDAFGVYYQRNACDAFGRNPDCVSSCGPCDNNNKVTSHTVPLAQLWFGKQCFTVADAFADGVISAPTGDPLISFVTFCPRFVYNERGVFIGVTANRYNLGCRKDWFLSGRIGLPVSIVEVVQRQGPNEICTPINPDIFDAIVSMQQEIPGNGNSSAPIDTKTVGIYRLDFLSTLQLPDGTPMVQYGTLTPGSTSGNMRIAGQDITDNDGQVTTQDPNHLRGPIYMYKQSSGKVPFAPNGLTNEEVAIKPPVGQDLMISADANVILPADGISGVADGQWGVFGGVSLPPNLAFDEQRDYAGNLGLNPAAQRQLFLAPVWDPSTGGWEEIGLVVENTITRVLEQLQFENPATLTFLCERGIDFARSECVTGAGDLFIDIWGGKQKACWFADGLIGFRLPTGSQIDDPRRIFAVPTGSNGHFAFKLGAEGGYMPRDWIGLKLEFFWNHFFDATEKRSAVFKGASVRNFGPCVDARVGWDTFILYADATFFSQRCCNLGWDVGYEFYAKTKDRFCFCAAEAADFTGVIKQLDNFFARENTNTQTHKLRAEIFNQWDCFQIFLGGSYIIAGKNALKETELHLGMKAYF